MEALRDATLFLEGDDALTLDWERDWERKSRADPDLEDAPEAREQVLQFELGDTLGQLSHCEMLAVQESRIDDEREPKRRHRGCDRVPKKGL